MNDTFMGRVPVFYNLSYLTAPKVAIDRRKLSYLQRLHLDPTAL